MPNQDAEAIARGNAFVATADNPSAIYYNPAGITQITSQEIQFGSHNLAVHSEYTSKAGVTYNNQNEIQPVPELYYTAALKDLPLTFGLGVYVPYGLGLEWPQHTPFRSRAIEGRLQYTTINPVIAWRINDQLSLAIGPTFNYGTLKLHQGLGITPNDDFKFRGDGTAFGFNAGLLWHPFEQWSFGANYHSETTMKFGGSTTVSIPPVVPSASSRTSMEAPFAQFGAVGVSFRPNPRWNIEFDVDWTDWDSLNTITFKGTPLGNVPFALNWQSSFLYEFGVTRYFDNGYFASVGYFFSQNSTSTPSFNPIVPDTDLHVGSIGFGHKGEHWHWALAGQIITGPPRTVTGSPAGGLADGKYQFFNESINFSLGYHY